MPETHDLVEQPVRRTDVDYRTAVEASSFQPGTSSGYVPLRVAEGRGRMEDRVKTELREFITSSFLFGDSSRQVDDDVSLIESGIVDSTGILELIEFLEEHYGINVTETETVPDNLGSIANLTRFVVSKAAAGQPA
jgi:acyl carrier protein